MQLRTFLRIRMRASIPRESKCCKTDGRSVWTSRETMGVFIVVLLTINGVLKRVSKRVYHEAVFIASFRTPFHRLPLRSL